MEITMESAYRTWAEIDLDALENNIRSIKAYIGENAALLAAVKADAYGHGAIMCARAMQRGGADRFALAFPEEAAALRKAGITVPLQLLGHITARDFETVVKYDIIPAVFSYETAAALSDFAEKIGKKVKIHIKLDTGMNRIGFAAKASSTIAEIEKISKLPAIEIEGIFTHFACADVKNDSFTQIQYERFMSVVNALENRGISIPIKHVCNSAATVKYKNMHLDMVRTGIICYGLAPSEEVDLRPLSLSPAMSIKTTVSHIHGINPGERVSYGGEFTADREMKIATLPIGYADGFIRANSGKNKVIAGGKLCNIVGRICMDQCMIDVSDVNNISVGDEAVIVGTDGNISISADFAAGNLGTIGYELVCLVGKRVPRVYLRNGEVTGVANPFA